MKSGQLEAYQVQRGGRWEYRVSEEQLDTYKRKYLDSLEMQAVGWSVADLESPDEQATHFDRDALFCKLEESQKRVRELEALLASSYQKTERVEHALRLIEQASKLIMVGA